MNRTYRSKVRSAAEAAAMVAARDTVTVPLGPGQPAALLQALGERDDYEDLEIFTALLLAPYPLFTRSGVRVLSGFYGPVERSLRQQGMHVEFVPADFRRYAHVARRLKSRVVVTVAAPPDARGNMSLSLHAGATVAEMHNAAADPDRLLIVEVNPHYPRTFGLGDEHTHSLSVEEADVIVESEAAPPVLADAASNDVSRAIAEHVSRFVVDGATLQTGIGGIPSDVVAILAAGKCGNFGIHSEMFTTGLMKLYQEGKVTNAKGMYDGYSICTFALGSAELHAWLHEQEKVRFLPVHLVNDPAVIGRNRNMVSINGALAVDLAGQIGADTIAGRQFSGIGGHEDFVSGASMAEGGHSIVCLPSTATAGGTMISRIVAGFPAGAIVTTPRHQADIIVTEYGAAEIAGLTVGERARALAAIAHPDFRDSLSEEAARLQR
ncbi:MAG TPA: acetyl-CoA hydrolase/transferase C-terminal domain-containing protein [Candidatus Limnocylindrales bacterium]|nr:acetyl-CoA hydrolase/transferase C-terminal domain-containing protein [Candidatus Limnocylindrales bacterium]